MEAVSEDLKKEMQTLLKRQLDTTGAYDIVVYPDADHEGDPVLIVEVKHRLVDRPINLKEVIAADRAARDFAWQKGERRFVHIQHVYDEKQKVAAGK